MTSLRPRAVRLRSTALLTLTLSLHLSSCLFLPAIDDDGYVACVDDGDCSAGRVCEQTLCTFPPWNDTQFGARRLVVVENPSEHALPAGTAVALRIGGDDAPLQPADVGPELRVTDFDPTTRRFAVLPEFVDRFADRFVIWVPLRREIPAGSADAFWLEDGTSAGRPTLLERPAQVFETFEDFATNKLPANGLFTDVPQNQEIVLRDSAAVVNDDMKFVWNTAPLPPPVTVVFKAKLNGTTCREVFVGLTADDGVSFATPSAGFFVDTDLKTVGEVAPTADSVPTGLESPKDIAEQPTAQHRFAITVDGARVRFTVDDVVFSEDDRLRPGYEDVPLYPTVEVGGDCSIDVDAVWMTPLPFDAPILTVSEPLGLSAL